MDERICPLCQQPNVCGNLRPAQTRAQEGDPAAITRADTGFDCWCMHQPVSATALNKLTPDQRGQVCICQACAGDAAVD